LVFQIFEHDSTNNQFHHLIFNGTAGATVSIIRRAPR
jgi:hypothetical protein